MTPSASTITTASGTASRSSSKPASVTRAPEGYLFLATVQSVAHRVSDDLRPVLHVEFVEDIAEVIFNGVFADDESLSKLLVGGDALDKEVEHLPLSIGERDHGVLRGAWTLCRAGELAEQ